MGKAGKGPGNAPDADPCEKPFDRPLHRFEREEAFKVFGDQLDYDAVRIHECTSLTNFIDDIGRKVKGMDARTLAHNNAIGFGNSAIFPIKLPTRLMPPDSEKGNIMAWMIHELTHVWQFQKIGWVYLLRAVQAQIEFGPEVYNYGGSKGLSESRKGGMRLKDYNLEQQATIAQHYYARLREGRATDAFAPFVDDIQKGMKP